MTLTQTSHDSSATTDKNKGCRQKIHSEAIHKWSQEFIVRNPKVYTKVISLFRKLYFSISLKQSYSADLIQNYTAI